LHDQERLRGERREVAVLFADAVDFTHLASSLDAEPIFNLINDLLGRLISCIHRYGGVVDKFTGDGLMAVFGAPIAHENDAELAVRAALDIQGAAAEFAPIAFAQLGAPLQIRIGIHHGPAVAGIVGNDQQAVYTVIGETVNLAARMESLARPGCILVSARVYQQTRALFDFRAMGTTHVKGIDQPVAVYEAIGDRSEPLPTRGVAGVSAILLGRDVELGRLRGVVHALLNDQQGRLVMIQGEAGVGKSRLVSEALLDLLSDQVAVWQGRGLPYAQGVGYGVIRSLLRDALRTRPLDAVLDVHVSSALRPFLRQILGLASAPEERAALQFLEPERVKQLTSLALREWLLSETRQRPIVLILEDFHWADGLSRDVLQALVNLTRETCVLLFVITRPRLEAPLQLDVPAADGPLSAPRSLTLDLQPLSPEHSRELLGHLIDLKGIPEQFIDTILTRAEGNPLYIEEFARVLIEKGVLTRKSGQWRVASAVALEELEIPTTLRGLMMSRVDRLPEDLQHVLRTGAVIGVQFSAHLLQEVESRLRGNGSVLPLLERLTDLGVLVERSEAGERVYAFRHILSQETLYSSLLLTQRPALHRTVAECIETLYAMDLDQQAEVLALHYDRARMRDRAMRYALLAGDRARERYANREAIEYYSRALQLSQHLGGRQAERWQAVVGLGEVQQHIGEYEEAIACYRAALDEWTAAAPEARAQTMLRIAQVWDKRGDLQEAEKWLHEGLAQIGQDGGTFPGLRAQMYSELGWLSLRRGDLTEARERLEHGLVLVGGTEYYDVLSSVLNRLGLAHYNHSEWDRAAEFFERALDLREHLGDVVGYARSLNNLGVLKQASGAWDDALADYERAAELHEQIGEVEGLAGACTNLGVLYSERGEWARAEENLNRSFAIAQRIAHPYEQAQAHLNLGRLHLLQGHWTDSARHLDTAIPLYVEAGARASLNLNVAYDLQGRLHIEWGQPDVALEWAGRSYDLLREVNGADEGDSVEWGRYEQLMGRIARAFDDPATARHHLERSAAILNASRSPLEAGRTAYWSGVLWLEQQQPERAREELIAARHKFERLGAAVDLRRVEELMEQLERNSGLFF
jgi:class 3 adenylate cyclase/tetratricopeptide (TPR) repeat protein